MVQKEMMNMPSIIDKRIISEYLKVALKQSNNGYFSKFILINDESYQNSLLTRISALMYKAPYFCAIIVDWVVRLLLFSTYFNTLYSTMPIAHLIEF